MLKEKFERERDQIYLPYQEGAMVKLKERATVLQQVDPDFCINLDTTQFLFRSMGMLNVAEIIESLGGIPTSYTEEKRLVEFVGRRFGIKLSETPRNTSFNKFNEWKELVWGVLEGMMLLGVPCRELVREFNQTISDTRIV